MVLRIGSLAREKVADLSSRCLSSELRSIIKGSTTAARKSTTIHLGRKPAAPITCLHILACHLSA